MGDNKIRIVGGMIEGWEVWSGPEGDRKIHRQQEEFNSEQLADLDIRNDRFTGKKETPHYFICFICWDYADET